MLVLILIRVLVLVLVLVLDLLDSVHGFSKLQGESIAQTHWNVSNMLPPCVCEGRQLLRARVVATRDVRQGLARLLDLRWHRRNVGCDLREVWLRLVDLLVDGIVSGDGPNQDEGDDDLLVLYGVLAEHEAVLLRTLQVQEVAGGPANLEREIPKPFALARVHLVGYKCMSNTTSLRTTC